MDFQKKTTESHVFSYKYIFLKILHLFIINSNDNQFSKNSALFREPQPMPPRANHTYQWTSTKED